MTSKYAADIAAIRKKTDQIPVLDERTKHIAEHLKKLNASTGKQWEAINKNTSRIQVLGEKLRSLGDIKVANISARAYVLAAAIAGASGVIGGLVSSRF